MHVGASERQNNAINPIKHSSKACFLDTFKIQDHTTQDYNMKHELLFPMPHTKRENHVNKINFSQMECKGLIQTSHSLKKKEALVVLQRIRQQGEQAVVDVIVF